MAEASTVVVVARLAGATTVTSTAAEVEAAKLASPEYAAVMLWLPTESVEVVNAVCPLTSVTVPSCVPRSANVIEPVGVPEPDAGATDAVMVTLCPCVGSVLEAETEVFDATVLSDEVVNTKTVTE